MKKDIFTKSSKLLSVSSSMFPKKNGHLKATLYLQLINFLLTFKYKNYFGQFGRRIDPFVLSSWKLFVKYNPYHFGEYLKDGNYFGLDYFEYQTCKEILDLYKLNPLLFKCMLMSGATEGNIYSILMGREYFIQKEIKDIFVLHTDLTDLSVNKGSSLLKIPLVKIGLNDSLGMSDSSLDTVVSGLCKGKDANKVGLIICLTMGYKKTGTSDDYSELIKTIKSLEREYTNLNCFVFIDAAMEGFTKPVMEKFQPFVHSVIKTIVFDAHKLFFTPYTTGAIVFRKSLVPINSLFQAGLLESRSSLPGIALWAFIHKNGITGIQNLVNQSHKLRDYFENQLVQILKPINIFSSKSSIAITVETDKNNFKKFKYLETLLPIRCNLIVLEKRQRYFVKIYFFPDLKRKEIDTFFKSWTNTIKTK